MADKPLTIKQEKYAQGLFAGLSQREAYKEAFDCSKMKDKTVDENACRLANNSKLVARIAELQDEFKERNIISVEYVLNGIKEVAERCMQAEPVMIRRGNEMVESGEYKFDSSGANKAFELLGKHLKMFTDKVEHSGNLAISVEAALESLDDS